MTGTTLPLAVAVLRVRREMTVREYRSARSALALRLAREGYALLESFDVTGDALADESTFCALQELAGRAEVSAVVVSAGVSLERVHRIADQERLQVVPVQLMVDVDVLDHGWPQIGGGRP